jgi:hypothetical protein
MEGNHVTFDKDKKLLIIEKDAETQETDPATGETISKLKKTEQYCYYQLDDKIYFKNISKDGKELNADKKHLLSDNVNLFSAGVETDDRTVHIEVELKDTVSTFDCKQDVHIRNTCKGGGVHDEDE